MLTAKLINADAPAEDIVIEGELKQGEIIPSYCCQGFDWEVCLVFDDPNPAYVSYWGACHNPDCPVDADDDCYRGVKTASGETIAGWLLDRQLA